MRVMRFDGYGDPDVLYGAEAETPVPGPGQVRLRVHAIGVNPADPKWRQGMFASFAPLPFPHVPGYDVAGVVDMVGEGVAGLRVGDRVFGMLDNRIMGAYAERAVIDARHAARLPDGLDYASAAALPTAALTGVQMIEDHVRPRAGETILVTGTIGAVGRFAVHAATMAGATVVAAVRASQADEARSLGARAVIVLGEGGTGFPNERNPVVDHVIDTVGGEMVAALCRRLAVRGRIITVATTPIPADDLLSEPEFIVVRADRDRLERIARAVLDGEVSLPIGRRLALSAAAEAHRLVEAGGAGKIVLEP